MANGWGNIDYKTFSGEMGSWFERQQQPSRPTRNAQNGNGRSSNDGSDDPTPPNIGEVMSMYDQYTQSNPLNQQEQQRLGELENRAQRLQPLSQDQAYGSRRIQGNPYSIDTTGLVTGAANLAKGGINNIRRNRREDFAGEYEDLATRQANAQQAREGKQEFLGDMLPEAFGESQQNYRTEIKEQGRSDRLQQEHNLKKKFEDHVAEIEQEQGGSLSPSIVTGMANTARDIAKAREGRAQELKEIKQGDYYAPEDWPNIDQDIEQLENEADQLYQVAGSVFTSQGGINKESVDQMNKIIGGNNNQPAPEPNNGDDMVSPNNQGQQMTPEKIEEIVRGIINGDGGQPSPSNSSGNENTGGSDNDNGYDPHDPSTW